MSALFDGMVVLGVITILVAPWVLMATLPFAGGGGAHLRAGQRGRRVGEPPT